MFPTITIDRSSPIFAQKASPVDYKDYGRQDVNCSDAFYDFLTRYLYNQSMEEKGFIYGRVDTPEYLASIRNAFNLGNQQQQTFIRDIYSELILAIPQEKQYLLDGYCFDTYEADDDSIVIEFITPELYFSVDIEERTINSSWTFSIKNRDGSRMSRGDFFNGQRSVRNVINSVCRIIIQWMEYGWTS